MALRARYQTMNLHLYFASKEASHAGASSSSWWGYLAFRFVLGVGISNLLSVRKVEEFLQTWLPPPPPEDNFWNSPCNFLIKVKGKGSYNRIVVGAARVQHVKNGAHPFLFAAWPSQLASGTHLLLGEQQARTQLTSYGGGGGSFDLKCAPF